MPNDGVYDSFSEIIKSSTPGQVVNRPCIISPPVNIREKYESSSSENSVSDFTDLCEDKPRAKVVIPKLSEAPSVKSSSSARGRKFLVSFANKAGHKWAKYNHGSESIVINGRNGPVLHLHRGITYYFCIDDKSDGKHFFFLTDSPAGGLGSKPIVGGFAPIAKGSASFKVDANTPRYFFYQSSKNMFEGGLVIIHDSK